MNEMKCLLADVCTERNFIMCIAGSFRKQVIKQTWVSPCKQPENQIDHIFISKNGRSLQDARITCGANAGSDHRSTTHRWGDTAKVERPTGD